MLCTFHMIDRLDAGDLRQQVRPAHKAYLAQVQDRIAFAGPLLDEDGQTMRGSLLVIDFPHREAALAWLAQEPFHAAGLYAQVQLHAFLNLWPQRVGFAP
ncbi:YciI family protein [Curvibacter sp. HBC28]|uniref:YciI family protein n=1 Tax=Curvibacter microcysteis TaxID=3026419 RepID=A0ABT5MHB3_9BURK|nr:YciI family protein [Curvibacter sp. HBC28]MDD0815811.1 YciI family protein [Curvibacter sp. HBC28]